MHAGFRKRKVNASQPMNEPGMQETDNNTARKSGRSWIFGIFAGAVLAIGLVASLVWASSGMGLLRLMGWGAGGRALINVDQPTVVRQIQQLQRLETVRYTMDKIISGEHENSYLPKFLAGDRLLLVVHGEVVAGINLASLQPGDVEIKEGKASIKLPAAEIFLTRIDNARTKVYSRDTGLFSSPDPNLESEVRVEAERQLTQSALQDGILNLASGNARTTMISLLQGLGFHEVAIR